MLLYVDLSIHLVLINLFYPVNLSKQTVKIRYFRGRSHFSRRRLLFLALYSELGTNESFYYWLSCYVYLLLMMEVD